METIKIFNVLQAKTFIKEGLPVVDCGVGKRSKVYIAFEKNTDLDKLMVRWHNHDFQVDKDFNNQF